MTRLYARALGGGRAVDSTPLNTPQGTTILSSIRINGQTVYTTYPGGTTAEKFAEYLKDILIPTLDKDSVIVMDCRIAYNNLLNLFDISKLISPIKKGQ